MNMRIVLFITLILYSGVASAQSLFENNTKENKAKIDLGGYVRGNLAGGSEKYDFSHVFAELCLSPALSVNKSALKADVRFREEYLFNIHDNTIEVKELYASYQSQFIDFSLGNQIIQWGRTDGFNPTNKITPINYFFISPESDDQRLSNFMLRCKIHLNAEIELDLIGIPFYKASVYRYELFLDDENTQFLQADYPSKNIENASIAARLNFEYPELGFSLSYSTGYNPFHGFDIQSIDWNPDGSYVISNIARAYRHNTLGADFSIPVKNCILRCEMACQLTEDYDEQIYIPNPDISYVGGLEYTIWGSTVLFQYIGKYVLDFNPLSEPILADPLNPLAVSKYAEECIAFESAQFNRKAFDQQEKTNHALFLSVNKEFFYNTLYLECSMYYNITSESYIIRPGLKYTLDDNLSLWFGGSHMSGPDKSIFKYSSAVLNGFFLSLKANF
jgi:hypothetical protein